jgi:hypothetical protein
LEYSVFNWRIILGGAASAAILTAGVAAPAFAASSPVPLNGITQGLSGSQAGGIFCALPDLPVSVGVTAAAGAIGDSCGSTQVSGSSTSFIGTPQQATSPTGASSQGSALGRTQAGGQASGPARTSTTPQSTPAQTAGASNPLAGLGSLSGAIPSLSNAASLVPNVGNFGSSVTSGNGSLTGAVGSLVPGNGEGGLNSVSNAVGGVTSGLSGGQSSSPGGPATGPLP